MTLCWCHLQQFLWQPGRRIPREAGVPSLIAGESDGDATDAAVVGFEEDMANMKAFDERTQDFDRSDDNVNGKWKGAPFILACMAHTRAQLECVAAIDRP